jgi:hypothetical protein
MSEDDKNDPVNLNISGNPFVDLTTVSHDPKIANSFDILGELIGHSREDSRYQIVSELFVQYRLAEMAGVAKGLPELTLRDALHGPLQNVVTDAPDKYGIHGLMPEEMPENLDPVVAEIEETATNYLATPEGRFKRVVRLIINLWKIGEPASTFRDYAREAAGEAVSDEYRDKLARRLYEAVAGDKTPRPTLIDYIGKRQELHGREGFWTLRESHGMLWLDVVALKWLDEWTDGSAFNGTLEDAREKARNRWQNDHESPGLLGLWTFDEPIPWKLRPVIIVAEHLWKHDDDLEAEWKRQGNPVPAKAKGTRHGENQDVYAKMPKTAGAATMRGRLEYQTGETAEPVDIDQDAGELTIDDERYTNAPGILRVVPQTWGVQPNDADRNKPHQTKLPLSFEPADDTNVSLAFRVFTDSQALLRPTAAKTVVALHLLAPETGELGTIDLGALTRWVNQGRARPGQKRNRETIRENLYTIRQLGIPPSLDGDSAHLSHNVQMLEIHPPDSLDKSADVLFGRTRGFQNLVASLEAASGTLGRLNGTFVMNADGFMRISGNDSDAARMYLTLCAMWNDHRWDPDAIPWTDLNELAVLANTLSLPARRYLAGDGGDRTRLAQDRKQTKGTAAKLLEEHELIGDIETKGDGRHRKLRILPTDEHRDAWERITTHGNRPIDV